MTFVRNVDNFPHNEVIGEIKPVFMRVCGL